MKARHRKGRATGGEVEDMKGSKDWEKDTAPSEAYAGGGSNAAKELKERKRGGRAQRKFGGKISGAPAPANAGRKPRKSGGRSGSDSNPFSSAKSGTPARGHSTSDTPC